MTLTAFSPQDAASLPGPDWLRGLRTSALDALGTVALPDTGAEEWRYSPISSLDLEALSLASGPPTESADQVADRLVEAYEGASCYAVVHNGVIASISVNGALLESGISVSGADDGSEATFGDASDAPDVFSGLNAALSPDPLLIDVPAGVELDDPIVVVSVIDGDSKVSLPRLAVRCGDQSAVRIVEVQASTDTAAVAFPVFQARVGRGARLRHAVMQDLSASAWIVGHTMLEADQEATVSSITAGFGGGYARSRVDCRLGGRGAHGDLAAVYFGAGDQTLDFRTFQDHAAPDTTSNLLYKGAVDDTSRSIYTGLITVRPEGIRTDAHQTNRTIKLSDRAWAESVPNLEIETNDVKCSHASTVGPVDDDERFYLESRGVPTDVADRLLLNGFFGEVIDASPVDMVKPMLRHRIKTTLEKREVGP